MRARGANAKVFGCFEQTPGTVPAAGASWFGIPLASHSMGEEQALLPSDIVGLGREMQDPTPDVATNVGDLVVPIDVRNFGKWLKLFFGAPTTTDVGGNHSHAFVSGAAVLPSLSIEVGAPEIPNYSVHRGVRGNSLKISMSRSGLLNATCSLIAIGETPDSGASAAGAGATAALAVKRFPQAAGFVNRDGAALGSVVAHEFTFSNTLETVDTIQRDGRIEDSDPGMVMMSGKTTVKFKDRTLLALATSGDPIDLSAGWQLGDFGLLFDTPRIFLPTPKKPIAGPNGIQVEFNWVASGAGGHAVTATLVNDVASYA